MSKTKNSGIPQWQSDKMESLISERWQEVWEIVEARKKEKDRSDRNN